MIPNINDYSPVGLVYLVTVFVVVFGGGLQLVTNVAVTPGLYLTVRHGYIQ